MILRDKNILINGSLVNTFTDFSGMTPERHKRLKQVLDKRQPGLTVVLENITDPHNISAVMRTCDAVGVQDLYILNTAIGLHEKWSSKSSSSAAKWLTIHQYVNAEECFSSLRKRFEKIYTTHLNTEAISIYELDLTVSVALIFGNEHSGVSEELTGMADGNIIIPQVGIIKSLNISVACAVTLYEAYRQKNNACHYDTPQLTGKSLHSIRSAWGLDPEI